MSGRFGHVFEQRGRPAKTPAADLLGSFVTEPATANCLTSTREYGYQPKARDASAGIASLGVTSQFKRADCQPVFVMERARDCGREFLHDPQCHVRPNEPKLWHQEEYSDQKQQVQSEDVVRERSHHGIHVAVAEKGTDCLDLILQRTELRRGLLSSKLEQARSKREHLTIEEGTLPGYADQGQQVRREDPADELSDHPTSAAGMVKEVYDFDLQGSTTEHSSHGAVGEQETFSNNPSAPSERLESKVGNHRERFESLTSFSSTCSTTLEDAASIPDALSAEFGYRYWSLPSLSALAESGNDSIELSEQQQVRQLGSCKSFNICDDSSDDEIEYFPNGFTTSSAAVKLEQANRAAELESKLQQAMSLLHRSLDAGAGVHCEEIETFLLKNYF